MEITLKTLFFPLILFSICILLTILALTQKNSNFMDVRRIIKNHFHVFRGSSLQCVVLFVVPLLLAVAAVQIRPVDESIINNLNVVLAILISMFFAMLSILSSFPARLNKCGEEMQQGSIANKAYDKTLGETFNSILFECILSSLVLICSFSILFFGFFERCIFLDCVSIILYYLFFVLISNVFVIIKRIMALFEHLQRNKFNS